MSSKVLWETQVSPPIPVKDLISWIFDDPQYDRDAPILIDASNPTRSISNIQARKHVRSIAAGLKAAGLKKGDCVVVNALNDIYYPMLVLGIIAAGGIWAGTNPAYNSEELLHHITISKAKFLISEPSILSRWLETASGRIPPERIYVFDEIDKSSPTLKDLKSWRELFKHGETDWVRFDDLETCENTTAAYLFSSGTTGLPKAAMLSHRNFIAQHTLVWEANPRPYSQRHITGLPIFHAAVAPFTHTSALRAGLPLYLMRRFDVKEFLHNIEKYQITDMTSVPVLLFQLIKSPHINKKALRSVRNILCGAAPLERSTQAIVSSYLQPGAPITQVFGMTETCCIALRTPYPELDISGSVGVPLAGVSVQLVDDDGNVVTEHDKPGEIWVRGPVVIKGYLDNPEANAMSYTSDGWFKCGDIAYMSSKNHKFFIVDRKKELIKSRGFQVAAPELEAVLIAHPSIADAAVIGVRGLIAEPYSHAGAEPDRKTTYVDDGDEHPRGYVVLRPDAKPITKAEVFDWLKERLIKYKWLSGGVEFIDLVPRNASGKIIKKALRARAKEEMGLDVNLFSAKPKL